MIVRTTGSTDRQLLDDFVHDQDPVAFQSLVSRYGSAVHKVCRGVLGDLHEAEDAFQATFLVLARRAPVIREPDLLGGWLRGVAYRVAVRARRRAVRRRKTEKLRAEMSRDRSGIGSGESLELREIVGNELDRLPDDYRQPLVLCYLDGMTHQEAAGKLGWPVGTVKVRLVRGRRMIRERLHRRGIALSALLVLVPRGRRASRGHRAAGGIDDAGHLPGRGGPTRRTRVRVSRCSGAGEFAHGTRPDPNVSLALGRPGDHKLLSAPVRTIGPSIQRTLVVRGRCEGPTGQFDRRPERRVPLRVASRLTVSP